MWRLACACLPLLLAAAVAACGSEDEGNGGTLHAVATTTQVEDLVEGVGGSRVDLHGVLEPNSDPHDYEPRPSDAREVAKTRLVFRSGGEVDGWLDGLVDNAGGDAEVVDLGASVRRLPGDPHWWQDPRNAMRAVGAIREALVKADPAGRRDYDRNARTLTRHLRRLDGFVARCMARVPAARRKVVTTHDSLGYFARRYDVKVVGALIPSRSTAAQPSARATRRLVEQIRDEGVRAIFPESSLNPKLERAVAREAGARVGEALWADTLGPDGSSGETYVASMRANADALSRGMTGRPCRR